MEPETPALRVVFAGTPAFAAGHLQALLQSRHEIIAVYTQPDRPSGRGKKVTAGPVKQLADAADLEVRQPPSLKDPDTQDQLRLLQPDVLVVVAYGLLLPQAVLDIPTYGCINVHGSLLPRWRGAAPIQRAVEAGDTESGITIMKMDVGLDTGPMLTHTPVAISTDATAGDLHDQLLLVGPTALLEVLDDLPNQLASATQQDDNDACYAHKIEKAEAVIDWQQPALTIHRRICAFNPFPVSWTTLAGDRLKVWRSQLVDQAPAGQAGEIVAVDEAGIIVACGQGQLRLVQLQLPGGKALDTSQLLLSRRELFAPGQVLGA